MMTDPAITAVLREFDRLRAQFADDQPTDDDFAQAPIITSWRWTTHGGFPALDGIVTGHPDVPDGRRCATSAVLVVDKLERWARTKNRWYRLGPRADARVH